MLGKNHDGNFGFMMKTMLSCVKYHQCNKTIPDICVVRKVFGTNSKNITFLEKTRSKRHNSSIHFHRIIIFIACYHNETNIFFYIFSSFPGSFLTKKNFRAVHPIMKFQPQNYKPKIYNPFRLATWKPLKLGLILRLRGVILDVYLMHKERYGWPFITSKRLLPWIQTSLMLT